ncbi:MAG: sigma-70 family RNA polymerase sigma factor [Ruminococcus sp.]|nr:sigma-70 family RNA polymerase sigma factor [Ruminococcus sp.]
MSNKIASPTAEENLGLVHLCANRFRNRGIEYEELYSVGCIGLLKAVQAFDCSRGVKFSTYAVPVILGEIKHLFRSSSTIKISRSIKEQAMKIQHAQENFQKLNGREATISELSKITEISEEDIVQALCVTQPPISLTVNYDDEDSQLDVPVEAPDIELGDILALRQVMADLDKKDRLLLELRYFQNMTQTKTAQRLGMTQVQVSRREKKLLSQMRNLLLQ